MRARLVSPLVPSRPSRPLALLTTSLLLAACGPAALSPTATGPGLASGVPVPLPTATATDVAPPTTPAAPSVSPGAGQGIVTGSWEGTGTLSWPRHAPSAVLLGDGRVLVVGDEGGKYEGPPEVSRSAEIWDPETGDWKETDYLEKARGLFAAVTLLDGRALIAGGVNAKWESFSSAYVYDPATDRWTKTGLMDTARADPAAAVLKDGRVLVAGGAYYTGVRSAGRLGTATLAAYRAGDAGVGAGRRGILADSWPGPSGRALATAELFDPRTGKWSETGSTRFARIGSAAATLADGRVLIVGSGWAEGVADRARLSAEVYDPATGRFSRIDDLPRPCAWWAAQAVIPLDDGDAVLMGCAADEEYDLEEENVVPVTSTTVFRLDAATGSWTTSTWDRRYPDGLYAGLPGGLVLAAGGEGGEDPYGGTSLGIRDAALYDTAAGTWTMLPEMPGARIAAAVVTLADGSALVAGGYSDPGDGYPVGLGDTFLFRPGG